MVQYKFNQHGHTGDVLIFEWCAVSFAACHYDLMNINFVSIYVLKELLWLLMCCDLAMRFEHSHTHHVILKMQGILLSAILTILQFNVLFVHEFSIFML